MHVFSLYNVMQRVHYHAHYYYAHDELLSAVSALAVINIKYLMMMNALLSLHL